MRPCGLCHSYLSEEDETFCEPCLSDGALPSLFDSNDLPEEEEDDSEDPQEEVEPDRYDRFATYILTKGGRRVEDDAA